MPDENTDQRVRVPLNGKEINLAQLDDETGGHGLTASTEVVVAIEGSPVTLAALSAAVAAHVPVWPPPPPTVEELLARIEALESGL